MQVEKIFLTMTPYEDSAISWYVEPKRGDYVESDLKISDCNRTITIDMSCGENNYDQKRKKIRALIDSLIRYESALVSEILKEVCDE